MLRRWVIALLAALSCAQQYAGDVIPNTLPKVSGAELAFFRINDPTGKNNRLTLINYASLQADGTRMNPAQVQRVVVALCGDLRNPWSYMEFTLTALDLATKSDPNINRSTVAIVAPLWPNQTDHGKAYPYTQTGGSTSNALVYNGDDWAVGSYNIYPKNSTNTSSFDTLDQIVSYYNNQTMFPNLKQVVISGHSDGGQMAQHYASLTQLSSRVPTQYWVANPNGYLWYDSTRPLQIVNCAVYNNYRDGLAQFAQFPMRYGLSLVNKGSAAVLANYNSKGIAYARGTEDFGDASLNCGPFSTGQNRNERFFEFIKTYPPSCSDPSGNNCDTIDYVAAGHVAQDMMVAPAGLARLFFDNFYGTHTRAFDFGYPRLQTGDDPHPNATGAALPVPYNTATYAGGMKYWGCFANQNPQALPFVAYTGWTTNNTLVACTNKCNAAKYTIAGLINGTACFCGNSLSYETVQVVNSSCLTHCPGQTSYCGGTSRLSIFSKAKPVISPPP